MAAHLSKGFREAETGIIELEDDDSDTVERLLRYLYSGDYSVIPKVIHTNPLAISTPMSSIAEYIHVHTLTYIIAEKFDLPGLKKLAGTVYLKISSRHPV